MKSKRLVQTICLFTLLMAAATARADGAFRAFEGIGEFVMRNTDVGADIVGRMTGIASEEVSDAAYRSFMQRLHWSQSRELRGELSQDLNKIESDFAAYRESKGRSPQLAEGEHILPDEQAFLRDAARALRSNRIDDLLTESMAFVEVHTARPGEVGGGDLADNTSAFLNGGDAPAAGEPNASGALESMSAPTPGEGEVPALPNASASAAAAAPAPLDLESLNLHWWQKVAMRFRSYRGFVRAFTLSEGDWRTVFGLSGKRFTANDLQVVRKYTRLLGTLNDYARMRLVIKAFAQERSAIYSRLNEATADATRQYLNGEISVEKYVNLRKAAAGDLQLNDITWESERRILNTLERCRELGGRQVGTQFQDGQIAISEQNIRSYQSNVDRITQSLRDSNSQLAQLRRQASAAAGDARSALEDQIDQVQRKILRDSADKDLWASRIDSESKTLNDMYVEFYTNYDNVELFQNLRNGRINSETVQRMDMADPFVANAGELDSWSDISSRALYNSTHDLVLNETKLFFRSQAGATRTFIRDMNQMTEKYFGKRFTDTQLGQEFRNYSQHIVQVIGTRLFTLVGLPSAATVAAHYAPTLTDRLWHAIFGDDHPAAGGDSSGNSSGNSGDANSGSGDDNSGNSGSTGGDDNSGNSSPNGGDNSSGNDSPAPADSSGGNSDGPHHGLPHGGVVGHASG